MDITAMFAYNQLSEGASELSKALGIPRIKHSGSKFKAGPKKVILNWGASSSKFPEEYLSCRVLNNPNLIDNAVDKVRAFNVFHNAGVSAPEFTTSRATAVGWLENGHMVFARTLLTAHSGRGIVIMDPDHADNWETSAPLYVKYIPKKHEYRIHIVRGEVIDVQRKGLKSELQGNPNVNFKIRNLANGFIYVRNDGHSVPNCVTQVAVQAVGALGLDFGAADIIYNEQQNRAYVLEVNCAPGLVGTTVTNYAAAIGGLDV